MSKGGVVSNIFDDVPTNTSSLFVMEKAVGGCEIYLPVKNIMCLQRKKAELRAYLDNQRPQNNGGSAA